MKRAFLCTDAGNVLTQFSYRTELVLRIVEKYNPLAPWFELGPIFGQSGVYVDHQDERYYQGLDTGGQQVADIWRHLVDHNLITEQQCPFETFCDDWCECLVLFGGVIDLYKKVQHNFPIVLVSNGDDVWLPHLVKRFRAAGLVIHHEFISSFCGKTKPSLLNDVAAWISKQEVEVSNCVYVDDLPVHVERARELGFQALEYNASLHPLQRLEGHMVSCGFFSEKTSTQSTCCGA